MPINSLAPGFVKLFYSSNAHGHLQVIPIQNPVDPGAGLWEIDQKNGLGVLWSTAVASYVAVVKAMFHTSASFLFAELWTMDSPTADPVFRDTTTLSVAGTDGTAPVAFSQISFTFRSQQGGLYRGVFLETSFAVNVRDDAPISNASQLAYSNYALSASSIVSARDGGYLQAVIRSLTKTNDKLREKFLLDI